MGHDQCDQIGRFLKDFGDIIFHEIAQIFIDFLVYFEKHPF